MMNDSSQQRLDEFRAGYRNSRPAASAFVAWLQILVIIVGFAGIVAILLLRNTGVRSAAANGGLELEAGRQLAAYLAEKKAYDASLDEYDRYLSVAAAPPQERAKVCFAAAKVAMEAEQYDRALAFLYQAEWLKPGPELQKEVDAKVMACLEHLGRTAQLRTELRERAQIGRAANDVAPNDIVLADLGDRVFTARDLQAAIDSLPAPARQAVVSPEKMAEMLRNIVAEHLLAEKARRQGLDKDDEIQAALSDQLNALMVSKLLDAEVNSKVEVTPEDVERYYKAEQARFVTPASAVVKMATRAAGAEGELAFADNAVTIKTGQPAVEAAGGNAAIEAVLAMEPGQRTQAFPAGNGEEVIYEVISKEPAKTIPLDEVRTNLERELRQKKQQEQLQRVIQSLIDTNNVKLYPERLAEKPS